VLDALGDHGDVQRVGHEDDGADQRLVALAVGEVLHEGTVDLESTAR
jgi:hypothetical protein